MKMATAAVAVCLSVAGLAAGVDAQAVARHYDLDIPKQSLDLALRDLAQQTGLQIALFADTIDGTAIVGPLLGSRSAEQALKDLLAPSGLGFKVVSEGTIAIVNPREERRSTGAAHPAKFTPRSSFRLAQSGSPASSAPAADAAGEMPSEPSRPSEQVPRSVVTLEEVIVTAQQREQKLIDVPISVVTLDGEVLERQGVNDLLDLALAVPSLSIMDRGASGSRWLFMRGVGNVRGTASTVGMYLDEASVSTFQGSDLDLRLYDLERVEVLRGPQGTLYGDGSMGGTIRFITKDPKLDRFEGSGELSSAFTRGGDPSYVARAAANLPIVDGTFGIRLTGTFENNGGWIDQPAVSRSDINDEELRNIRVKALWKPSDALDALATVIVHRNDTGAQNVGEDEQGNYTQVFGRETVPWGKSDYDFFNLTLRYDFGSVRLLSSSSYIDSFAQYVESGYRAPLLGPRPDPTFDVLAVDPGSVYAVSGFVQEVRLVSASEGAFNWTLGGAHRNVENESYGGYLVGIEPGEPFGGEYSSGGTAQSWALFGEVSYRPLERLEVGVGLRYFTEELETLDFLSDLDRSATFDSVNPRAFVSYRLGEGVRTYASVGKGFRSGGFSGYNVAIRPYDSDVVWSYELGTKMSLRDGAVDVEVAAFFSDFKRYQSDTHQVVEGVLQQYTTNAGDGEIKGVDWNFSWRVDEHLSLGFGGEVISTEFTKIVGTNAAHVVGDPFEFVPDYHFTVWGTYDFSWGSDVPGFVRVDYNQQGESEYRNWSVGPWYVGYSDVINMLNATLGANLQKWSVELFARNILDDRGYVDANSHEELAARSRPRTIGIQFGRTF